MSIEVTLNVFSGRENPRWLLNDRQEQDFLSQVNEVNTPTLSKPSGVAGILGYRGFTVRRSSESPRGGFRLLIHEGIIDFGQTEENRVSNNRQLEEWLLNTAPEHLDQSVKDHALTELNTAPLDTTRLFSNREILFNAPPSCPTCFAQDAPAYNPSLWNIPTVQPFNNCYNYANNQITNTFAQPGRAHGHTASVMGCPSVEQAAIADGLVTAGNFSDPLPLGGGWYVALVIWPGQDYHWYRQGINGCWSHKPGQTAVRNTDNSGNPISDPQVCDRGPYTDFCAYMVTKNGIIIH